MKRYSQATGGDLEEYELGEWVRYEEAFDSSAWVGGDRVLEAVKAAVMDYYAALDARKHGDVAAANCVAAVEAALGLEWVRGASLSPHTGAISSAGVNQTRSRLEAFRGGRSSNQSREAMNKTTALRAKKIRTYIIEHPGCTKNDIYAAHPGERLTGGFELIQRHGLARYEGGGKKGPARWYATEAAPKNHEPVRAGDHDV